MLSLAAWGDVTFAEPAFLWLLTLPALLAVAWVWRMLRRSAALRWYTRERSPLGAARFRRLGDWAFWLCLLVAMSLCIVALARPQMRQVVTERGSADFVILQDASASMYARDVPPDRWQRSVAFLRAFANALSWKGDRVALALFAHLAAPQLRLTKDPNAYFFFLDHLGKQSPFSLDDDPTWDTNIEEGVYWGLKVVEADERLFGRTSSPKAFVVVSDGQAWSGQVANAIAQARARGIVLHVVGVGTAAGGIIPDNPASRPADQPGPVRAVLDRASLRAIAEAGGGEYFEIGRESDRAVAFRIIGSVRRLAGSDVREERREEAYWSFLLAAACVFAAGTLLVTAKAELWCQVAAVAAALLVLAGS